MKLNILAVESPRMIRNQTIKTRHIQTERRISVLLKHLQITLRGLSNLKAKINSDIRIKKNPA